MPTLLEPVEGSSKYKLEVSVTNQIGYGRCGTVFATTQESIWEHTNLEAEPIDYPGLEYLPPLVLKVADETTYLDLGREALNYEIMSELHGVSIPCFYGWFNLHLDKGETFAGMKSGSGTKKRTLSVLVLERMGD
ncbi:hypothetical protein BDQ17DRAFT_1336502 [Cyathus striatus]|nr:hypothetical protein BDQ17DRAFT_1336502 [Cyathus striatus]